jgi:hypothetical protein
MRFGGEFLCPFCRDAMPVCKFYIEVIDKRKFHSDIFGCKFNSEGICTNINVQKLIVKEKVKNEKS